MVKTPVTPNHLTTVRLVSGLVAAGAFGVGEAPWQFFGGGLFILSMFFDRADGTLARLSCKTSRRGHTYDLIADGVVNTLAFVGISVGLRESALGLWALPLGAVAGAAVAAIFWLTVRIEELEGPGAAEISGAAGFDPDDALLIVPIAMIVGGAIPLIVAAAIGAPAFLAFFLWHFRRQLWPTRSQGGLSAPGATMKTSKKVQSL